MEKKQQTKHVHLNIAFLDLGKNKRDKHETKETKETKYQLESTKSVQDHPRTNDHQLLRPRNPNPETLVTLNYAAVIGILYYGIECQKVQPGRQPDWDRCRIPTKTVALVGTGALFQSVQDSLWLLVL